jgi:hypothetical protein
MTTKPFLLLVLTPHWLAAQQSTKLDTTTFIVMGEGLAAGMANFGLSSIVQEQSFPARIARQVQTAFPQPLIEPPGLGDVLGYAAQPVIVPKYPQGQVRRFPAKPDPDDEAPTLFVFNLAVPGMRLADSVSRRPVSPLIQRDPQQTAINLILGFPSLILDKNVPLWSQFEYAQAMIPTIVLIELGYFEALEAAFTGDPARMPEPPAFRATYARIVRGLRAMQAEVIATTIPNPIDTGCFIPPQLAAAIVRTPASSMLQICRATAVDFVTRNGLNAISRQLVLKDARPLPAGSIMTAAVAAEIRKRVQALNGEIVAVARENRALVYDLNAFFARMRSAGVTVGATTVTGHYLGGFYSLDGHYPGATGHALIANDILTFLNASYQRAFPLVDVASILKHDPMAHLTAGGGPMFSSSTAGPLQPEEFSGRRTQ